MFRIASLPLALASLFPFASIAFADCDEVLRQVGMNYSQQFSQRDLKSFVYKNLCSSDTSSSDGSLDAFYDNIGVGLNYGSSSKSEFCEKNSQIVLDQVAASRVEQVVFAPAVKAWESCKRASGNGLEVRPSISTNGTLVSFYLRNLSSSDAKFLGAAISPSDVANCTIADENGGEEKVDTSTRLDISRGGIAMMDCFLGADNAGIIPAVAINIRTSIDNFQINTPSFDQNPPSAPPPEQITFDLRGKPLRSQAYWGTNRAVGSGWIDCPRRVYGIPDDFDIVVISTRTESWGRTGRPLACGHQGGFCDSAGEDCEDVYIREGCAVNKEWHQWYRQKAQSEGWSYTKQAACK